ncbi:MAG TPA: hypothetical protein VEL28_05005 [Candidatus Binatia bacterium]|nr:hypothetical protein [Candidatus Binatia bacterium]
MSCQNPAFRTRCSASGRISLLSATLAASLLTSAVTSGCGPGGGGDGDVLYAILFRLIDTPEPLSELQLTIAYHGGGEMVGTGSSVDCEVAAGAGDAEAEFDDDDISEVTVEITGDEGLEEDTDLVRCTFAAEIEPTSGNFPITITDAVAEDGSDVPNAQVTVRVQSISEIVVAARPGRRFSVPGSEQIAVARVQEDGRAAASPRVSRVRRGS